MEKQCTSFTRWSRIIVRHEGKESIIESKQSIPRILGGVCRKSQKQFMAVYLPANCAPENEVEEFYIILGDAIQRKLTHNFLIVLGDLNVRLGPEDALHTYHSSTNRNGSYLVDFLLEHSLIAANTQFQKRKGKLWTFKDRASDNLKQLDYIRS